MSPKSISVSEDPDLRPDEKQVSFVATKAAGDFRVHSETRAVTNRLLAHPAFEEESRRVVGGDVVAVTGRLPVGCLKVQKEPRADNLWSGVVTGAYLG